jgi:hypothetical protein
MIIGLVGLNPPSFYFVLSVLCIVVPLPHLGHLIGVNEMFLIGWKCLLEWPVTVLQFGLALPTGPAHAGAPDASSRRYSA